MELRQLGEQILRGGVGAAPLTPSIKSIQSLADTVSTAKRKRQAEAEVIRAAKRIREFGARAAALDLKGRGFLESSNVSENTDRLYEIALQEFLDWCTANQKRLTTDEAVDQHLSKFFDALYFSGKGKDQAVRTFYG